MRWQVLALVASRRAVLGLLAQCMLLFRCVWKDESVAYTSSGWLLNCHSYDSLRNAA